MQLIVQKHLANTILPYLPDCMPQLSKIGTTQLTKRCIL